tara:strand:+ start:1114 stop:1314 length:201 start_codon:yes stop_codon:yes gene_type:complete
MDTLQLTTDSFPAWKAIALIFYPMTILLLVEFFLRIVNDDDDDDDGGKGIRVKQSQMQPAYAPSGA